MAGTAYHMEALRKQRVIERKMQALKNLEDSIGQADGIDSREDSKQSDVLAFAEIGQYQQARSSKLGKAAPQDDVVFEEVVHDPNFKYRILKESGAVPQHVDPIYKIMYPGGH